MTAPRRKVVRSRKLTPFWSNTFECELECGHNELASGRTRKAGDPAQAPMTVSCRKCEKTAASAEGKCRCGATVGTCNCRVHAANGSAS